MAISKKMAELMDKLISIWNDRGFVLAVSCSIETDEEAQRLLDFINSDKTLTANDITVEALYMAQERKKAKE